ncbi:metallophosphoesterase [Aeromonas veronii]
MQEIESLVDTHKKSETNQQVSDFYTTEGSVNGSLTDRHYGLGGIFRNQVWYPPEEPQHITKNDFMARCGKGNLWRGGLPRKHRSSIFPEDIQSFDGLKADILVTHEAPSAHPHGFQAIDKLAKSLEAKFIIHGHHHDPFNYGSQNYMNIGLRDLFELTC